AESFRQPMRLQLLGIGRDLLTFTPLALGAGERGLEGIGGRRAVAALALLVEMHRRAMQAEGQRSGFRRFGRATEILACELGKCEFARTAHLPQEIRIELRS